MFKIKLDLFPLMYSLPSHEVAALLFSTSSFNPSFELDGI